jgi:replicative DNA helicase
VSGHSFGRPGDAGDAGDGGDARPLRRLVHQLIRGDGGSLPAAELTAVPSGYLRAAEPQRRALLAGLMDAAGSVTTTGNLQFSTPYQRLAEDVHELVVGLGHRCTIARRPAPGGGPSGERLTVTWTCDEPVFTVERKHLLHKSRSRGTGSRTARRWITAVTPVPPVPVRCVEVDNADHLYLATRAMLPTHNSTLGLDIARAASVKHAMPSAIFSLEMSKTEITMRLLSAEARVPLHHMRSGTMTDDDWARLARRMGEVAEAPLYIDDSPNLTMMEIRAKARRLRQRNDLQLIVIDYLQLMSGNKKAESRQQEVSELSRSLKLLAKELEIPVIAMSQLNRGAEARTDKKPQISDLRESGCLPASTRILRADTGAEVTLGELFESGAHDVPVWSLDDSLRYVRRHLTHVFSTGRRQVFRLRLASGKQVTATANHPFLTYDGWRALGDLAVGHRLAVPRHVPPPETVTAWPEAHVVLLAHLISSGSIVEGQSIRCSSGDEANLRAVAEAATACGITAVRDRHTAQHSLTLRPLAAFLPAPGPRDARGTWLDDLRLLGLPSQERYVPPAVAQRQSSAAAVRHLHPAPHRPGGAARHHMHAGHHRRRGPAQVPQRDRRAGPPRGAGRAAAGRDPRCPGRRRRRHHPPRGLAAGAEPAHGSPQHGSQPRRCHGRRRCRSHRHQAAIRP